MVKFDSKKLTKLCADSATTEFPFELSEGKYELLNLIVTLQTYLSFGKIIKVALNDESKGSTQMFAYDGCNHFFDYIAPVVSTNGGTILKARYVWDLHGREIFFDKGMFTQLYHTYGSALKITFEIFYRKKK